MNTTKHTPGPWNISTANRYAVNARGRGIATAHGTDDLNYSEFFPPTEKAAGNARLIAAAPDLLEALDAIVQRIYDGSSISPYSAEYRNALNAIAKAIGTNG